MRADNIGLRPDRQIVQMEGVPCLGGRVVCSPCPGLGPHRSVAGTRERRAWPRARGHRPMDPHLTGQGAPRPAFRQRPAAASGRATPRRHHLRRDRINTRIVSSDRVDLRGGGGHPGQVQPALPKDPRSRCRRPRRDLPSVRHGGSAGFCAWSRIKAGPRCEAEQTPGFGEAIRLYAPGAPARSDLRPPVRTTDHNGL